jgi:hypothetical protein
MVSPMTGSFSRKASITPRPRGVRRKITRPTTSAIIPPTNRNHQSVRNPVIASKTRVGKGSSAFSDLKKVRNRGRTKIVSTKMVTTDMPRMTIG